MPNAANNDNLYIILELFVDPPETNQEELYKILEAKKVSWNQKVNLPDGLRFRRLVERYEEFKTTIANSFSLECLAKSAKESRLSDLERYIQNVAAGSTITEKQIETIIAKYKKFFTEETIRQRVVELVGDSVAEAPSSQTPPPPSLPVRDSSAPSPTKIQLKKVASLLEGVLGESTIYDALGVSRTSSIQTLRAAANRLLEEAHKASVKSSTITAQGELGGLAKQFFQSEKHRKAFDGAWAQYKIEQELQEIFAARCADKTISYELYARSIRETTEKGVAPEEAEWLVYDYYVNKRKCPDPRTATVALPQTIQCPKCFRLNDVAANCCVQCGYKLRLQCPNCGAENVGAIYCFKCGVSFGDVEFGARKLEDFKDALSRNDLTAAREILDDARKFWQYVPESKQAIVELRNKIARVRFNAALEELRTDRLDEAKRFAESLSFDGAETLKIREYRNDLEKRFQEYQTNLENQLQTKRIIGEILCDVVAFKENQILQTARTIGEILRDVDQLKSQNLYFSAFERFKDAEKIASDGEKIREIKNELTRFIDNAQREFAAAVATNDVADKERFLNDLARRFPDFEDAKIAMRNLPPNAPDRVEARETAKGIEIVWERSRSLGEIRYKIVRTPKKFGELENATLDVDAVCLCDQLEETSFVDATAEDFAAYVYSVISIRDGVGSSAATSRPVLRVGQIAGVRIDAKNGSAKFLWTVSPNVREIVVERTQIGVSEPPVVIENVDLKGFKDADLTDGLSYEYAVALRYLDADGTSRLAPKEYFIAKPIATAPGILDLSCRFEPKGRTIQATWTPPPKGKTFFLVSRRQATAQTKLPLAFQGDLAELEKMLGATAQRPEFDSDSESNEKRVAVLQSIDNAPVQYVWPVTVLGESVTIGKVAHIFAIEGVSNVRTQQIDNIVYVSWDWPVGLERVAIFFNYTKQNVPQPNDGFSKKVVLTKEEYEKEQAWLAPRVGCAQIFPLIGSADQESLGNGTAVFLQRHFIKYHLEKTKPNERNKSRKDVELSTRSLLRVKFEIEEGEMLPEILVVYKFGQPPLHRYDGVPMKTISATDASENVCELETQDGCYYRCYLANVEDRTRYVILDPREAELALFERQIPEKKTKAFLWKKR